MDGKVHITHLQDMAKRVKVRVKLRLVGFKLRLINVVVDINAKPFFFFANVF